MTERKCMKRKVLTRHMKLLKKIQHLITKFNAAIHFTLPKKKKEKKKKKRKETYQFCQWHSYLSIWLKGNVWKWKSLQGTSSCLNFFNIFSQMHFSVKAESCYQKKFSNGVPNMNDHLTFPKVYQFLLWEEKIENENIDFPWWYLRQLPELSSSNKEIIHELQTLN